MSDDYEYNHKFENYVQQLVQEAHLKNKKITKIINAKADGELKELIEAFGTYCVVSSDEIAKEMQNFKSPLLLADYIDAQEKQGLISDAHEPEHIDYIIDLSDKADEASLELFGKKS
ncbi:MAG: hypothetical protein RBS91_03090 [Sulfurimonadaceae bacterium]|jgi:hypothetical protein|nr:hypothetical protein [Sulfurimonadaceae bacterium]